MTAEQQARYDDCVRLLYYYISHARPNGTTSDEYKGLSEHSLFRPGGREMIDGHPDYQTFRRAMGVDA